MQQKTCAAIHDISGLGKCSLTAVLPILSSAGVSVGVLPTAVLSTQTGGLNEYTYRDLTDDMRPIMAHWQRVGARFDAVFSGFLGSAVQAGIVSDFVDMWTVDGVKPLFMCDPAMADNGRLYNTFSPDFVPFMARLCEKADIIVPNVTEAAMLCDTGFEDEYDLAYIEDLARKLYRSFGTPFIVITGVNNKNRSGAASYDAGEDKLAFSFRERIPGMFHSTGDLFASALLGGILNDIPLGAAADIAIDFTVNSIRKTVAAGGDSRFGLCFEPCLADYIAALKTAARRG